ncbi:MAG: MlaE family lipid ABC transporter permease subunit [Cyanothece sp. SIO1E1]|nr:MlaE family lipid ABC transporter permease subunit [Cyanothece sp. SIO1E1]
MNTIIASTGLVSWLQRLWAAVLLGGRVIFYLLMGKIDRRVSIEQMMAVGPASLVIALITAAVIGMIFTIQVAREFLELGAGSAVGGILAIALARELCPVMMAVVVAGRVGSAFAAEIGTMRVTEQVDALYMLKTSPVEYLVIPRVVACCIMVPALTVLALFTGLTGGLLIANNLYGIANIVFLDSVQEFLEIWDIITGPIKGIVFGALIAIIGCSWGLTTSGGAKGVGESTTAAVVTSLLAIFVADFFLSWLMFQGLGSGAKSIG